MIIFQFGSIRSGVLYFHYLGVFEAYQQLSGPEVCWFSYPDVEFYKNQNHCLYREIIEQIIFI
jgi:hypothetical protein